MAPGFVPQEPAPASSDIDETKSIQKELDVLARMAEVGFPEEPAAAAREAPPPPEPVPATPPPPSLPVSAGPGAAAADDRARTPEEPAAGDADQALLDALDTLATRVQASERNMEEILSPLEQAVRGLERQLESLDGDDPGGEGATGIGAREDAPPAPAEGLSPPPRPAAPRPGPPPSGPSAAPPAPEPPIPPSPAEPPPAAPQPPAAEMRAAPEDRRADAGDTHTAPPRFDPDARRSAAELIRGLDFGQGRGEAAPPAGVGSGLAPAAPEAPAGAPPARPAFAGPAGPSPLREPEAGPAFTVDARSPAGRAEDRWPDTDILELDQPIEPADPKAPLDGPDRFDRFIPADDHEGDFGRVERPSRDFEGLESGRRILRALAVVGILAAAAIGGAVFFVWYGDDGGFMERRFGDELEPPTPTVAGGEATAPMPTRESAELTVPPADPGSLPLGATLGLQAPQADPTMPVAEMDTPPTPEPPAPAMSAPAPAMPAPAPAAVGSTTAATAGEAGSAVMPEPPAEPSLAPSPEVAPAITTAPSVAAAGGASTSPAPPMAPAQTATLPPSTQPENIGEAVDWLKREAQRGEADAQIALATLYAQGTEVEQDYRQAAHWFREAALQDRAEAQFNLGVLHERGLGVQQDPLEALLWYLNAAEKDHAMAQYNLGVAYADGKGVPEDYVEARKWFTKAAERGLSGAQFNLGVLYEEGYGTDRDLVQAYRWYKIADAYGDAEAGARAQEIGQRLSVEDMARATALIDAFTVMPALPQESPSFSIPAAAPGDFSREVVKEIQTLLTRLNFDPGPADGIPGGRTVDAIREFQRAAGLLVDGQPTVELLAHMRTVMGE